MKLLPTGKNKKKVWNTVAASMLTAFMVPMIILLTSITIMAQNSPLDGKGVRESNEYFNCTAFHGMTNACTLNELVTETAFRTVLIIIQFTFTASIPIAILLLVLPKIYDSLLYKKKRKKITVLGIHLLIWILSITVLWTPFYLSVFL